MAETIEIADDFDLAKIKESGQCFRVSSDREGNYRFIAKDRCLLIRQIDGTHFEISCSIDEWEDFWTGYFDLGRKYSDVRERCSGDSDFVDMTMDEGRGLRVLDQDAWEMLITFIISQRKNMPAIARSVEALCQRFGERIEGAEEIDGFRAVRTGEGGDDNALPELIGLGGAKVSSEAYAFPTPERLASASEDDLRACSLGYRAPYIADTARMVASGEIDLRDIEKLSDEELFARLKECKGVGDKVANCVALFGYGRTSLVPVDVWIARAIDEEFAGDDPFTRYGEDAGIVQQYVFYHMTQKGRS